MNQSTKKDSSFVEQAPANVCRVDWLQDESVLFLRVTVNPVCSPPNSAGFLRLQTLPLFSRLTHIVSQDLQFEESAVVVGNGSKARSFGES